MMSSQKAVEAVLCAFQFCFDSFLFLFFKLCGVGEVDPIFRPLK